MMYVSKLLSAVLGAGLVSVGLASSDPTSMPSSVPTTPSGAAPRGIGTYEWGGNSEAAYSVDLTVDDPILYNTIDVTVTTGGMNYIGLWPASTDYVISSHTEQATGGPITKTSCSSLQTCSLKLYQNDDTFDPVPAGDYRVYALDSTDLVYSNSRDDYPQYLNVTIDPYISAWGGSLTQTNSATIERGTDLLVTWDGLVEGNVIELRLDKVGDVTDCAVDFHVITAAEEALTRGTISLKTAESAKTPASSYTDANLVPFAITGDHVISVLATSPDYDSGCSMGATAALNRTIEVIESDSIAVNGKSDGTTTTNIEAGSKLNVTYDLNTATTSGTYVGLWKEGDKPTSHVVDPDYTSGHPLSAAFLPVGISGPGFIYLSTPVSTADADYIVYIFNKNDATFSILADTSYLNFGDSGPHDTTMTVSHNTDVHIIAAPTGAPTGAPSKLPTGAPSSMPTAPTGAPTGIPTSSPSFVEEPWGEYVWTEKRHRKAGMCENQCSGHGTCEVNGNCKCFKGLDGEDEWTGPDCSLRTCPFDFAWAGSVINSNNLHPWAECSNKGICDRSTGECNCFTGYEGAACQRTVCPDNCNDQGTCWPEKHLASKAGRIYDEPWDAMKHVGCLCDAGYRGPACDQQECPSGADPLSGYGNEAGRDCSGRGICDYSSGICSCFTGFFGTRCQHQTTVM